MSRSLPGRERRVSREQSVIQSSPLKVNQKVLIEGITSLSLCEGVAGLESRILAFINTYSPISPTNGIKSYEQVGTDQKAGLRERPYHVYADRTLLSTTKLYPQGHYARVDYGSAIQ